MPKIMYEDARGKLRASGPGLRVKICDDGRQIYGCCIPDNSGNRCNNQAYAAEWFGWLTKKELKALGINYRGAFLYVCRRHHQELQKKAGELEITLSFSTQVTRSR